MLNLSFQSEDCTCGDVQSVTVSTLLEVAYQASLYERIMEKTGILEAVF